MTDHVIDLSNLSENQRDLHDFLLRTELSGISANAYRLSHARIGRSGYSVGHSQVDLSERPGHIPAIAELIDGMESIPEGDRERIKKDLAKKGISAVIEAYLDEINAALQTVEGLNVVDRIHKDNLSSVNKGRF
ncbi:MAG: hypothetical protein MI741_15980 [Rhodospirillales bacterium]|nr:hypothetical protein [Rhodospirillales bacterium]